jgi:hypothetical protein
LKFLRKAHYWVGTIAALFIIILAVTGIVLDHRDDLAIKLQLGVSNKMQLASRTDVERLKINPAQATELALTMFGAGSKLHKVELRTMRGGLVYKLESDRREAIYIDPVSGVVHRPDPGQFDIVRWSKAIHTGEGLINNPWIYDIIALSLIVLAGSGVWLFGRRGWR